MQTKPRRRWQLPETAQRLEIIRQNLDKTDAEIGSLLGITRQGAQMLRKYYGINKVHVRTQHSQRRAEQMRKLEPGLAISAAASQMGVSLKVVRHYGKMIGYQFVKNYAARYFHWRERIENLPPLLTISEAARELGVSYGLAAILCSRHKYKATIHNGREPARVPIRRWSKNPRHERRLASLQPAQA